MYEIYIDVAYSAFTGAASTPQQLLQQNRHPESSGNLLIIRHTLGAPARDTGANASAAASRPRVTRTVLRMPVRFFVLFGKKGF